jgi:hypothetical protein
LFSPTTQYVCVRACVRTVVGVVCVESLVVVVVVVCNRVWCVCSETWWWWWWSGIVGDGRVVVSGDGGTHRNGAGDTADDMEPSRKQHHLRENNST